MSCRIYTIDTTCARRATRRLDAIGISDLLALCVENCLSGVTVLMMSVLWTVQPAGAGGHPKGMPNDIVSSGDSPCRSTRKA
jgi:hypothetical protein